MNEEAEQGWGAMGQPVPDYIDGTFDSGYANGMNDAYVSWFHRWGLKDAGITGEVTHGGKKCVDILKGFGTTVAIISDGIDSHPNLSHVPRQRILIGPGLNGAPPLPPIVLTDFNYICGVKKWDPPVVTTTTTQAPGGPGGPGGPPVTPGGATSTTTSMNPISQPNLAGLTGVLRICTGEGATMNCYNTGSGLAVYFTTGYNGVHPSDEKLYLMGCSGSGPTRLCTGMGYGRLFSGHITSMSFMNSYSAAGSNRSSIPSFSFICQDSQIFPVIYNVEDTFCSGEKEDGTFCFRYNLGRDTERGTVIAGLMAGRSGDVWYHASDTGHLSGFATPTEGLASQISLIYDYPYLYKTYWQTTTGNCDSKMAQSLIRLRNIFKDVEDKGNVNVVVVDLNPTSFPISVESLKILAANPGTSSIMGDITNSIRKIAETATIILVGPEEPVKINDDESYLTYLICNKLPTPEVTSIPNSKNYLLDSLIPDIRPHVFSICQLSNYLSSYSPAGTTQSIQHGGFGEKRLQHNGMSFPSVGQHNDREVGAPYYTSHTSYSYYSFGIHPSFCASGHTDEEMSWGGVINQMYSSAIYSPGELDRARARRVLDRGLPSSLHAASFAGGVAAIIHGFKKNQLNQFQDIDDVTKILKGSVHYADNLNPNPENGMPEGERHESNSSQEVYRRATSKRSTQTSLEIAYAGMYNMNSMEQPQILTSDLFSSIVMQVTHDPQIYIKGWNRDYGYGTTNFSLLGRIFSSYINGTQPFQDIPLPCQRDTGSSLAATSPFLNYNPKYDLSDMRILGNTESKSGWPDIGWPPFSNPRDGSVVSQNCSDNSMYWPKAVCSGRHLLGFFCSGGLMQPQHPSGSFIRYEDGILSVWENSSVKIFEDGIYESYQEYKYDPQTHNGKEYYTNVTPSITAQKLFYHTGVFTGTVSVTNPCISGLISGVHTGIYSDIINSRCWPAYSAVHTNSYFSNCISATCLQSDGTFDNPGQRNLYYTGEWTGSYTRPFSNAMIANKVIRWDGDGDGAWVMGHGLAGGVVNISGHTGESQLAIMTLSSPDCPIGFFSPFNDAQSFVRPSGIVYHAFPPASITGLFLGMTFYGGSGNSVPS